MSHKASPTNEVNNALGHTQSTSRLNTATQLNNLGAHLARRDATSGILALLELPEIIRSKVDEAGADGLANKVLGSLVFTLFGDLDLELAAAEAKLHHHVAAGRLLLGGEVDRAASQVVVGADTGIVLLDLIPTSDSQVDAAFANKGRDIGSGEEDEGDGEVFDKGNVETGLTSKLDIGAFEEV